MAISLKTEHLKRYKDIAWLLMKYGRSDLVKQAGLEEALTEETEKFEDGVPAEARELAEDFERMGPTFIKLAQLLSTRADLLPPPYLEALARLQDKVEPFSFGEVEQIVSDELGVRLSKAFSELDYRAEARNLVTFADNLAEFERIVVPLPLEDFSSARVLTMDFIRGKKIT